MRISRISLENYRQYRKMDIEFIKGSNDLHVIIGRNGVGKTTLLNAINWCLYEKEPIVTRKEHSLPILNLNTLKEAREGDVKEVSVEISFEDEANSSKTIFTRKNTYRVDEGNIKIIDTSFSGTLIEPDGILPLVSEAAVKHMSRIIPQEIKEFFFFDGERLDDYFSQSQSSQRIRKAVFDISQVQVVSSAGNRANEVVKALHRETSKGIPSLEYLDANISKKENELEDAVSRHDNTRIQIRKAEETISRCDQYLKNIPDITAYETERERLIQEKKQAQNDLCSVKNRIRSFIREFSMYFSAFSALKNTSDLIKEKKERNELPPSIDRDMLEEILGSGKCKICGTVINEDAKKKITSILEQINMGKELATELLETGTLIDVILSKVENYPKLKNNLLSDWQNVENRIRSINKRIDDIENRLVGYGEQSEIKKRQEERKENEKLLDQLRTNERLQTGTSNRLRSELVEKKNERSEMLNKHEKLGTARSRLEWLERACDIIGNVEKHMMDINRLLIQEQTDELFRSLVWKKNSFSRVEIDEDYGIWLYSADNYSCLANISAAERALLALSYTIALHRVSGFEPPIIIDTPVSRISDDNRRSFAKVLSEVSKQKQIILLFTPAEYSEEIKSEFIEKVASQRTIMLREEQEVILR